jgi:hypothetical protein
LDLALLGGNEVGELQPADGGAQLTVDALPEDRPRPFRRADAADEAPTLRMKRSTPPGPSSMRQQT